MPDFGVIRIEEFQTKQTVWKLVRNGKCRFDDFIDSVNGTNFESELAAIYAVIEDVADNNGILPATKYKKLKLSISLKFKGYEAKSKHLRVYLFHDSANGQIIVLGGRKGDQEEDIDRFERILKEYEEFKKKK